MRNNCLQSVHCSQRNTTLQGQQVKIWLWITQSVEIQAKENRWAHSSVASSDKKGNIYYCIFWHIRRLFENQKQTPKIRWSYTPGIIQAKANFPNMSVCWMCATTVCSPLDLHSITEQPKFTYMQFMVLSQSQQAMYFISINKHKECSDWADWRGGLCQSEQALYSLRPVDCLDQLNAECCMDYALVLWLFISSVYIQHSIYSNSTHPAG